MKTSPERALLPRCFSTENRDREIISANIWPTKPGERDAGEPMKRSCVHDVTRSEAPSAARRRCVRSTSSCTDYATCIPEQKTRASIKKTIYGLPSIPTDLCYCNAHRDFLKGVVYCLLVSVSGEYDTVERMILHRVANQMI